MECLECLHLTVSNSIIHPAEIFIKVEKAILALNIPEIEEHIKNFHQVKCSQVKNVIASYILDASIQYCTNSAEMQLTNASLLVFQYNFDNKDILLQFEDQLTLQPGQIKELNLNFVTNIQVVPDLSCDLQECIAVASDLQFS